MLPGNRGFIPNRSNRARVTPDSAACTPFVAITDFQIEFSMVPQIPNSLSPFAFPFANSGGCAGPLAQIAMSNPLYSVWAKQCDPRPYALAPEFSASRLDTSLMTAFEQLFDGDKIEPVGAFIPEAATPACCMLPFVFNSGLSTPFRQGYHAYLRRKKWTCQHRESAVLSCGCG